MAQPMLMTERRIDRLERAMERLLEILAEAQTGFDEKDKDEITEILEGIEEREE